MSANLRDYVQHKPHCEKAKPLTTYDFLPHAQHVQCSARRPERTKSGGKGWTLCQKRAGHVGEHGPLQQVEYIDDWQHGACTCGLDALFSSSSAERTATGDTSDGYHTFNELYAYRKAYNALLFNEWAARGLYDVHKSWTHSGGEPCFGGGWFIVVAETLAGQISNHYKAEDWPLFRVPERERGNEWDGHTPQIALERLLTAAVMPTPSSSPVDQDTTTEGTT